MRSAASLDVIRATSSLSSLLPGTIARRSPRSAVAPAAVSSRRSACRLFASGPWQRKHLSARTGRTWRLKLTASAAGSAARAVAATLASEAKRAPITTRYMGPFYERFRAAWWSDRPGLTGATGCHGQRRTGVPGAPGCDWRGIAPRRAHGRVAALLGSGTQRISFRSIGPLVPLLYRIHGQAGRGLDECRRIAHGDL